jgi:photosystem II stability/assembly factor-like uncharacterized protein
VDLGLRGTGIYVDRIDQLHGWIGATKASPASAPAIVSTGDGGAHWTVQTTPCSGGTSALDFSSDQDGWLYCRDQSQSPALYRTADGGRSWAKVSAVAARGGTSPNTGSRSSIVRFTSPSAGWLAQDDGTLLSTNDAGQTWHSVLQTGESPVALDLLDSGHGWLVGTSLIWLTSDNGQTWHSVSPFK